MTETLICEICDKDWERERKRGRKPKTCPNCTTAPAPVSKAKKPKQIREEHITPSEAAQARRDAILPDREYISEPLPPHKSWWCKQNVPMHKTCVEYGPSKCTCKCHK